MVQVEIKKRKAQGGKKSGLHCFFGKVICGECSGVYGSKVWHSTSKYRRTIWQCNNKFKNAESPCGGTRCKTPHLNEDSLKRLFVEAFNQLYTERAELTEDYDEIIAALTDTTELENKATALAEECEIVKELMRKCINENAHTIQSQDEYYKKYEGLVTRYDSAQNQLTDINEEKLARKTKCESMKQFISDINNCADPLTEFDEPLWYATVESITIKEKTAVFEFKDSTVIEINI